MSLIYTIMSQRVQFLLMIYFHRACRPLLTVRIEVPLADALSVANVWSDAVASTVRWFRVVAKPRPGLGSHAAAVGASAPGSPVSPSANHQRCGKNTIIALHDDNAATSPCAEHHSNFRHGSCFSLANFSEISSLVILRVRQADSVSVWNGKTATGTMTRE